MLVSAVYGGYFGAAMSVIVLALLGLTLDDDLQRLNGLKNVFTDVMLTAYDIHARFAFFFRSARARTDDTYDFSLAEAARATSAAPTYFEPIEVTLEEGGA